MAGKEAPAYSIAVVDEDLSTQRLLAWTLSKSWGYTVSSFSSVAECSAAMEVPPDIVLMSVGTEKRDAAKLCRTLRKVWPEVIVLFLTAPGEHDAASRGLKNGAWDYFDKPVDLHRLQHSLQQSLLMRTLQMRLQKRRNRQHLKARDTLTMDQAKSRALVSALKRSGGNVKEAARLLGVGRTTMYKLMARYKIDHHGIDSISEV